MKEEQSKGVDNSSAGNKQADAIQPGTIQSDKSQSDKVQPEKVDSGQVQPGKVDTTKVQSDKVESGKAQPGNIKPDSRPAGSEQAGAGQAGSGTGDTADTGSKDAAGGSSGGKDSGNKAPGNRNLGASVKKLRDGTLIDEKLIPIDEHEEVVNENGESVRRKGVYLLPNLFTTAALFFGFYAIMSALLGNFEAAALAIFGAMVFDGLDGRVARLTNTTSEFGVQYDSLSDMVSFGVAPALVMYSWALVDLGKFGIGVAFVYVAGAALRLARFNTQVGVVDKKYFIGLASPAAAAVIAGMVWVGYDVDMSGRPSVIAGIVTALMGLLMVSNVKYTSFKDLDLRGRVPFVVMLAMVLAFGVVSVHPPLILLLLFGAYALSGLVAWIWSVYKEPPPS
ncbi:MAG: CDP-diacylglycerol--serine O-phosphatidyltransferase [Gammaproteobacteria bacterium]|nr:CDP-diacylglycerol--serine O-phosphatidyltransferase [Gammaproteobacteria bacterium]